MRCHTQVHGAPLPCSQQDRPEGPERGAGADGHWRFRGSPNICLLLSLQELQWPGPGGHLALAAGDFHSPGSPGLGLCGLSLGRQV